jgi:hypothetical protein
MVILNSFKFTSLIIFFLLIFPTLVSSESSIVDFDITKLSDEEYKMFLEGKCDKFNGETQDSCNLRSLFRNPHITDCSEFNTEYYKNQCYAFLYKILRYPSHYGIKETEIENFDNFLKACLSYNSSLDDSHSFLDEVDYSNQDCLYYLADITGDESICNKISEFSEANKIIFGQKVSYKKACLLNLKHINFKSLFSLYLLFSLLIVFFLSFFLIKKRENLKPLSKDIFLGLIINLSFILFVQFPYLLQREVETMWYSLFLIIFFFIFIIPLYFLDNIPPSFLLNFISIFISSIVIIILTLIFNKLFRKNKTLFWISLVIFLIFYFILSFFFILGLSSL